MNLSIREATTLDAALIADLSRQTFFDTFAAQNSKADMDKFLGEQFTRGRLMLEVGQTPNTFLLAYANDRVAGYVKLREGRNPPQLLGVNAIEIARLYACKNMIGKGIGQMLMQTSLDIGKQRGKELAWLCVWEHNKRAIDFYQRWGFEKCGDVEFILGDDVQTDWVMQLAL